MPLHIWAASLLSSMLAAPAELPQHGSLPRQPEAIGLLHVRAVGPETFDKMDLNHDGVLNRAEFELASAKMDEMDKEDSQAVQAASALKQAAVKPVDLSQAACTPATSFNASLSEGMRLSEQLYKKLKRGAMNVLAEERAEAASLDGLRELKNQAIADLQKCDEGRAEAALEIEKYQQEMQDLMSIVNSSRFRHVFQHSLLAKKTMSIRQTIEEIKEASGSAEAHSNGLHGLVDRAAQRLRLCMQKHEQDGTEGLLDEELTLSTSLGGNLQSACMEEEAQLNRTYTEAHTELAQRLQTATAIQGADSCHVAVTAEFHISRVRLESQVTSARKRICTLLAEGQALEDGIAQLQKHLEDANTALTVACRDGPWVMFESGVYILAGLIRSRPYPASAVNACQAIFAQTSTASSGT